MLIPVDDRDPTLPDDVAALAASADLAAMHDALPGSNRFGRTGWRGVSELANTFTSSNPLGDDLLAPREEPLRVPKLEYWTVQAHAYKMDAAAKVSLLGRLFGGEAKVDRVGVVHEAKRFTVLKTEQGRRTEFGVAVRIYAATQNLNTTMNLTLPNLAADAQLNVRDSRVAIDVVGYSGPLGTLLPAPKRLDVESLAAYLSAFHNIQATVFGDAGLPFLTPALLSYEETP